MTKFLNISTDNTLGGNSPSDVVVSSQKALKEYIDSHGGGGGGVSSLTDIAIAGTGIEFEGGSSVNYTPYGSPTIDSNYVASDFSASNRILPTMVGFVGYTFSNLANSYPWEFKTKINLATIGVWNAIFGGIAGSWGIDFYVDSSNRLAMNLSSNGTNYNLSGGVDNVHGTTTLSANTDYWLKCGWDGSKYYAELSTDGTNYTTGELSFTSSTPIYSSSYDTYLGFRNEAYLHGSISLPDTSFSFNNGQFEWNVVETGKTIISSDIEAIVNLGMPDYTAGVSKTVGTNYTADKNGFIKIDIINSSWGSLVIDGVTVVGTLTNNANLCALSFIYPIAKGQVYNASGVYSITFYPAKGG